MSPHTKTIRPALLVLEDGEAFHGEALGADTDALGEVVFNTGMTGYQEVLTDPSYEGQIVVMTYPHIGNYGVNDEDPESRSPWVRGFVIRNLPAVFSNYRATGGLEDYLKENGIAGITEVDTRRLTRHLRDKGAMRGVISTTNPDAQALAEQARRSPMISDEDLIGSVTSDEPYVWAAEGETKFKVASFDFGIKHNILRSLAGLGCEVTIHPARTTAAQILGTKPDGVFVSNGPGDPETVQYGVEAVEGLLGKVPVFGICLGHQLLARAAGFDTYKLPFGHHGVNHPVARLDDGQIEITTQNHNFAVVESAFGYDPSKGRAPAGLIGQTPHGRAELTHLNLNDNTVEGFRLLDEPAFSVQYHPEAGPGPHDSRYLFEQFLHTMEGR
ncbi:MAG TPA: glutamine-hydrolyzing carbamoyl-phosphate synthase small subunit [Actinomycetota bacterium]|nr:glutamine-hydrolyzing carbamoyl-phosphate synthase small subunit [Actinomycetota bacterium]